MKPRAVQRFGHFLSSLAECVRICGVSLSVRSPDRGNGDGGRVVAISEPHEACEQNHKEALGRRKARGDELQVP